MPSEVSGPDRVIPTDHFSTGEPGGAVKLRMYEGKDAFNHDPVSIPTFVRQHCEKGGNRTALCVKRDGQWVSTSYTDYYRHIRIAARGFIALGLEPFHSVAILGFNSPEWFLSSMGSIFAGGFSAGLYPTNNAEVNKFIMVDSRANILVCEDKAAVEKMWAVKDEVISLKKIVQYSGKPERPGVISWKELMEMGEKEEEERLEERLKNIAINNCAVLIYTSGTTGNPKGVMLSHDNLIWTTMNTKAIFRWVDFQEIVISFLPLSHIAGLLCDIFGLLSVMGTVYFADKTALKGSLLTTMREVRPTSLLGVPRVFEKVMEGMVEKGKAMPDGFKKKVGVACKRAGLDRHLKNKNGLMYKLGQKMFYCKVKEALGLDRCGLYISGGAPLTEDTFKYFASLDMVIHEMYGMSESTGPHTLISADSWRLNSVGKTMPGHKSKLLKSNSDNQREEGEILLWGRNCMMGYLHREECDMDEEGWVHSGDLAHIDSDGFVFITGRIKELLITSGGENISPLITEEAVKRELNPLISNAVLIGDKRKYLTMFLTLRTVTDKESDLPTGQLTPAAADFCASIGSKAKTVDDILGGPDAVVMSAIQKGMDRVNAAAVSNAARVQKWTVLPEDISVAGGELGPTLKLKRFYFNKKYAQAIDKLYA